MEPGDFGLNLYVDLRTGTLHNLVGARSADVLKERENTFVSLRIQELIAIISVTLASSVLERTS